MEESIFVIATSAKGKSRIGKKLIKAIIEEDFSDYSIVALPSLNQCLLINKEGDPDFMIIEDF